MRMTASPPSSHHSMQMMVLHQQLIWNCVVRAAKLPLHILHVCDGWDISFHTSFTVGCSYFTKTYFDFAWNMKKRFQVWKFLQTTSRTAAPTDVSHQRPLDFNSVVYLCYLSTGGSFEVKWSCVNMVGVRLGIRLFLYLETNFIERYFNQYSLTNECFHTFPLLLSVSEKSHLTNSVTWPFKNLV